MSRYRITKRECLLGTAAFGPSLVLLTTIRTLTTLHPCTAASCGSAKRPLMGCYVKLHARLWSREDDCSDTDLLRSRPEGPDVQTHLLRRLAKNQEDHGVPRRRARRRLQTKAEGWWLLSKAGGAGDAHNKRTSSLATLCVSPAGSERPPLSPDSDSFSLIESERGGDRILLFPFSFHVGLD